MVNENSKVVLPYSCWLDAIRPCSLAFDNRHYASFVGNGLVGVSILARKKEG